MVVLGYRWISWWCSMQKVLYCITVAATQVFVIVWRMMDNNHVRIGSRAKFTTTRTTWWPLQNFSAYVINTLLNKWEALIEVDGGYTPGQWFKDVFYILLLSLFIKICAIVMHQPNIMSYNSLSCLQIWNVNFLESHWGSPRIIGQDVCEQQE